MKLKYIFFLNIFILLQLVNNSYLKENYFSMQLIYNEAINGIYTRQVLSEKYLCVLASEDKVNDQKTYRYIIIYDLNTGAFVKKIKYISIIH